MEGDDLLPPDLPPVEVPLLPEEQRVLDAIRDVNDDFDIRYEYDGTLRAGPICSDDETLQVATLARLTRMTFHTGMQSARGLAGLAGHPRLRLLEFSFVELVDPPPDGSLSSIPNLRTLHFSDCTLPAGPLCDIGRSRSLRELYFYDCNATDESCLPFRDLGGLEALELDWTKVSDVGDILAGLSSLKRLSLAETLVDDRVTPVIGTLIGLTELIVGGTRITQSSVPVFASLPKLEMLTLSGIPLDRESLIALSTISTLRTLFVDEWPMPPEVRAELVRFRQLTSLYVEWDGVPKAEKAKLRRAMPGCDIP